MFVGTVGKFLFIHPGILGFLLTKAGNYSLHWYINFISISVCFQTYLILSTCLPHNFQCFYFCQNTLSKQHLISPFSSWGHPCQRDRCEPVGGMSCSPRERMAQPLSKLRTFWEHAAGWVSLQARFLPGKLQCRGEEKSAVSTHTSGCHGTGML